MSYVAFAVLYIALAILVGRVCRLNSRLEETIVYDPIVTRREHVPRVAASAPRGGAASADPDRQASAARPLHEVSAVR